MEKNRDQKRHAETLLLVCRITLVRIHLRKSVPHTHEHTETCMARDRSNSADHSNGKTIGEHIRQILQECESQRYRNRIYDPVKLIVVVRISPCCPLQEEELETFF